MLKTSNAMKCFTAKQTNLGPELGNLSGQIPVKILVHFEWFLACRAGFFFKKSFKSLFSSCFDLRSVILMKRWFCRHP